VRRLVAAINDGDRDAFLATLTSDATLTDDGNPRSLRDWIDREIFSAHGHMNVEREQEDGLHLLARYRNDTWGEMRTFWRFEVLGDKISRIDTGQAEHASKRQRDPEDQMQAVLTPDCRTEPATNRPTSRAPSAGLDVLHCSSRSSRGTSRRIRCLTVDT
jgi:hypothetical protein